MSMNLASFVELLSSTKLVSIGFTHSMGMVTY